MNRCFRYLAAISALSTVGLGFSAEAQAQVTLPFIEDWEGTSGEQYTTLTPSLTGAPEWAYEAAGANGRLRLAAGPGFPAGGSYAATMDATSSPLVANLLTLTLDMSNYALPADNIVVDLEHSHHGEESHANDRIWVRGSSADPFVELYNVAANQGSSGVFVQALDLDVSAVLTTAGQQFSSTFQLRLGQEDDSQATSTTILDGRTYDNIVVRRVLPNDMTIRAISLPQDTACGEMMQDVEISVLNTGANTQTDVPLQVTISGDVTAMFNTMVPGDLLKNQTASVIVGQIDTFAGANINISAQVMLPNDDEPANDTLAEALTIKPTLLTPSVSATVCSTANAEITVQSEPLTSFALYASETGGDPLDVGDTLTVPSVETTTTFWVERVNAEVAGGPVDSAIGAGAPYGSFDDGLVFDVSTPVILRGVHVYPSVPGIVQVQILNSSNTVIGTSEPYQVEMADIGNKTRIDMNIPVPTGSGYQMIADGSTTPLFRNIAGAAYPYSIQSWVDITGNTPDISDAYYFFYDWQVALDVPACNDGRTEVEVTVDASLCSADVALTMTGATSADPGDMVEYVTTMTNNGPDGAAAVSVDLPTPAGLTFVSNSGDCTSSWPCALGDVASGEMAVITSQYTVDADFSGSAMFSATATATSTEGNPGDESASVSLEVMGMGAGGMGAGGMGGMGAGGNAATTTTTTGSGGGGDPIDEEGCSCRAAGTSSAGGNWAWLATGLALMGLRRRRRHQR